jgi:hypothetical protein
MECKYKYQYNFLSVKLLNLVVCVMQVTHAQLAKFSSLRARFCFLSNLFMQKSTCMFYKDQRTWKKNFNAKNKMIWQKKEEKEKKKKEWGVKKAI